MNIKIENRIVSFLASAGSHIRPPLFFSSVRTPRLPLLAAALALTASGAMADADITGLVYSRDSSLPIDFANVSLIDTATGMPLQIGASTDEEGRFLLAAVPAGSYILRVGNIGSIGQEREVTVEDTTVDLGRIELADDARLLQEVVVTGQKSQMSVSAGKRVYNVSSNISSAGASADELLTALPSVDVDSEGTISLRGNSDVTIWINGKEMGMTDDNRSSILRQIPAEAVESIEVMTNPSSRHSTEGTAGIINIRLKEDTRRGLFGSAEANVDSHGTVNANASLTYNRGRFESFAGLGLKSMHAPAGSESLRSYTDGRSLGSQSDSRKHENSIFLRLGSNWRPDDRNTVYLNMIGTLGHQWGHTTSTHIGDIPGMWRSNTITLKESGDTRGANILLGYRHTFNASHSIDMNVSYNIWQGENENRSHEEEIWSDTETESLWHSQTQDMRISNWEAALDYSGRLLPWLRLEAGFKGNYTHENSPASYFYGESAETFVPLPHLYNRFIYDTDINALYVSFSGSAGPVTFAAGLRGELWSIRTRSLGYGDVVTEGSSLSRNDFALFPSASAGWKFMEDNELSINYSRRIRRPYGPQLNTFENIADPSEVHLGNPQIMPEYSDAAELTYIRTWPSHMLSLSGYLRSGTDMISHVSFLAPMASDPDINTMYYGHANIGNRLDTGLEIISRNTLFSRLTLTTTVNLYNSHMKAWTTDYPLHGSYYRISGPARDRFVWSLRCMASVRLPWDLTFQATGRYTSRRLTAQGTLEPGWDVEAGLRRAFGPWSVTLLCKDIFDSKSGHDIVYGNGYTQSIKKWGEGRTLRLALSYSFGSGVKRSDAPCTDTHIDTGGYGSGGHSHSH